MALALAVGLLVNVPTWVGCGDSDTPDQGLRLADDLAQQLKGERLLHQRDNSRLNTRLAEAEADYQGATLAWAGTAAAVFLLIILLAKERRARRVVGRVLRLVLDRFRER